MTRLVPPSPDLGRSWVEAVEDFLSAGERADGSGDFELPAEYADPGAPGVADRVVAFLLSRTDPDAAVAGRVPCTYLWIVDGDGADDSAGESVVGFLALRHELDDFLFRVGGHIGYSVRPGRRREGHAGRALVASLDHARALGLERVLVTCDDDNLASAATAIRGGGVFEALREGKRRFWIDVPPPAAH